MRNNLWNTLTGQKGDAAKFSLTERQRRQFAKQHFLSWLRIREWKQTHQQLTDMAGQLKLSFNRPSKLDQAKEDETADYASLHRALLTGLLSFIAQKTG